MAINRFDITLVDVKEIAPGVKHFSFERSDKQVLDFIPGQFISLHFPGEEKPIKRSYSIATVKSNSQLIEFAASYVSGGIASDILFSLKIGDTLNAEGPYGRLILKEEQPKRYILVSTGTGVTPYRAMLTEVAGSCLDKGIAVVLLQGVRLRQDLLYGNEFLAFAEAHPHFSFHAYFSRETLSDAKPHEHCGYVQSAFETLELDPLGDVIYLCGNPGMVDDAFEALKAKGFDNHNVRREKYISGK